MNLKKMAATAAAAAAVGVTAVAAAPLSAQAVPNGCSTWTTLQNNYMWAHSYCNGGNGQHRVRTYCSWFGAGYTSYGPWVGPGRTSTAGCDRLGSTTSIVVELR